MKAGGRYMEAETGRDAMLYLSFIPTVVEISAVIMVGDTAREG